MFVKSDRGWLVLSFVYEGVRCKEYLHLPDNRQNRREAVKLARDIEAEMRAGAFDYAHRFPNSRRLAGFGLNVAHAPSLGEFACTWAAEKVPHWTPATRYDYECLLKVHLLPHLLAVEPLDVVDDGHVNRFIADLVRKRTRVGAPLSARRINMVIARLRTIFAAAHRRGLIERNPMLHVENLRERKPEVDPFDLDEARQIMAAATGWERAFVAVLLFTGLRPGEALALTWEAIDWAHGLIRVRQTVSRRYGFQLPKTPGSEREVEMIETVRAALAEQRARSQLKGDLVFPSAAGTALDLANFRVRNWPRLLRGARVRPRVLYQCRHSFARLAIELGDTPQHVAAMLGHTSVEMVFRVYARWLKRPESAALAALDRAISIVHPSSILRREAPVTGGAGR
jgi:integrase